MMITNNVKLDLMLPGYPAIINAVQEDRYTRQLKITLTASGEDWSVPEGVSAMVHYSRPDGTGGQYDTLPDGAAAWSAAGNVLTVVLAPQVLAVAGSVNLWITLLQGQLQLSTFAVLLNVAPKAEPADSGTYIRGLLLTDAETQTRYRIHVAGGNLMMEVTD